MRCRPPSWGNLTEDPNLFYAFAVVQPGHTVDEAELALVKELDRLRDEPVTERELARARNQFTRDYVLGRETVQQKASVLARAAVLHNGDVASADAEFDLFQRVTAADIQRVAQAYFTPSTRLVITVTPKLVTGGVEMRPPWRGVLACTAAAGPGLGLAGAADRSKTGRPRRCRSPWRRAP